MGFRPDCDLAVIFYYPTFVVRGLLGWRLAAAPSRAMRVVVGHSVV